MTLRGKFIYINHSINTSYSLVLLITLSLLLWCFEFSYLYSSSIFLLLMAFIFSTEYYLSVRDVSVEYLRPSYSLFIYDLYPGRNFDNGDGILWYFWVPNILISWFVIGSFLGGDIASDLIFFFFLGMYFYGVTLSPVPPDKT